MKILITTDSSTYNIGGVTTAVITLCEGLKKAGHHVKILTVSESNRSYRQGEVYFIKSVPFLLYPGVRMSFSMNDALLDELVEWQPDIIHAQTELSTYHMAKRIRKRSGAAFVMTCHTDYAHYTFGCFRNSLPVRALMCLGGTIVFWDADAVTTPSQKAVGLSCFSLVRDKLVMIPNGIELDQFRTRLPEAEREALRRSLGIGSSDKLLVCISRVSKEKSISEIIKHFPTLLKKLPDAKLLIAGEGPYKAHIEKLAKKLGIEKEVILTGAVPHSDIWKYYAIGDVYVSASTFEVHSMSYLEAMAQGLPLLCRRDEALKGMLEHGRNGLIYDTPGQLVCYAYKLLTDEKLRQTMGQRSLQMVLKYSSDVSVRAMIEVYEKTINADLLLHTSEGDLNS
jgi:1,2-diacylglycerol 3-alpha-glucosyltransferase